MEAQQRIKSGEYGQPFSHYCMTVVGMSPSRCYELVAIANGTKTLEEIREGNRERKQKERADVTESNQPIDSQEEKQEIERTKTSSSSRSNNPTGRPAIDVIGNLQKKIRAELKGKNEQQLSGTRCFLLLACHKRKAPIL